eukprot:8865127-Pyramimonas_sp.AAC.1
MQVSTLSTTFQTACGHHLSWTALVLIPRPASATEHRQSGFAFTASSARRLSPRLQERVRCAGDASPSNRNTSSAKDGGRKRLSFQQGSHGRSSGQCRRSTACTTGGDTSIVSEEEKAERELCRPDAASTKSDKVGGGKQRRELVSRHRRRGEGERGLEVENRVSTSNSRPLGTTTSNIASTSIAANDRAREDVLNLQSLLEGERAPTRIARGGSLNETTQASQRQPDSPVGGRVETVEMLAANQKQSTSSRRRGPPIAVTPPQK